MARGLAKHCIECSFLIAQLLWLAGADCASAAGYEIHGAATYFVLLEVGTLNPTGRLDEPSARRIASADWSLDLNRTTAAFGVTGRFGACNLGAQRDTPLGQGAAGIAAAVAYHAYMPPSYADLPVPYQRDFVYGSLIGLTEAVRTILADATVSQDAKLLAVGQYLHFVQDMFLDQEAKAGTLLGAGAPYQALTAGAVVADKGAVTDAAIRALAFTYQVARTYNQTGALPPLPPADRFDGVFYAPLAANERAQITKTLQEGGVFKYLDPLGRWSSRPAAPTNGPGAAAAEAQAARLKVGFSEVWKAAHPKAAAVRPPEISAAGAGDFVNYDAHPEWLIRKELRRGEMDVRRPIDDLALAQQASAQLRTRIGQFEAALSTGGNQPQRNSIAVAVQALKKFADGGDNALKQSTAAKNPSEKQRTLGLALSNLRQGLRYAGQTESTIMATQSAPGGQDTRCQEEQAAATAAFERQLNEIVKIAVAVGFGGVSTQIKPEDQRVCLAAAFDDVRGVLKKGAAPEVPEKCRLAAKAGRAALVHYAAAHVRTWDTDIEVLLSDLVATPTTSSPAPAPVTRPVPTAPPAGPQAALPPAAPAAPTPAADCAQAETHWRSVERIKVLAAYQDHLARFPNCAFATLARARIEALTK